MKPTDPIPGESFEVPPPLALTPGEGALLVEMALAAIRSRWDPRTARVVPPASGALVRPSGAFVTIYRGGELRGCLGIVKSADPLWRTVTDIAVSSATRDPRFDPVAAEEYDFLSVEISVLGPLTVIPETNPDRIPSLVRVGEHGLMIRLHGRSGLLLPQVPVKYGWDALRFLDELCFKAGLPGDAWRRGAELSAFRCSIFKGRSGGGGTSGGEPAAARGTGA